DVEGAAWATASPVRSRRVMGVNRILVPPAAVASLFVFVFDFAPGACFEGRQRHTDNVFAQFKHGSLLLAIAVLIPDSEKVPTLQIGRASCRESGEVSMLASTLNRTVVTYHVVQ